MAWLDKGRSSSKTRPAGAASRCDSEQKNSESLMAETVAQALRRCKFGVLTNRIMRFIRLSEVRLHGAAIACPASPLRGEALFIHALVRCHSTGQTQALRLEEGK